jgi:hypothetical protein
VAAIARQAQYCIDRSFSLSRSFTDRRIGDARRLRVRLLLAIAPEISLDALTEIARKISSNL